MNTKRKFLLMLAVTGGLFAMLALFSGGKRPSSSHQWWSQNESVLQIDFGGAFDEAVADFAAVRDTLDYHFAALNAQFPVAMYEWQSDAMRAEGGKSVYRGQVRLAFRDARARAAFTRALWTHQGARTHTRAITEDGLFGSGDLRLEMPAPYIGQLNLDQWNFRLSYSSGLLDFNA